jgi:hypothetical protein
MQKNTPKLTTVKITIEAAKALKQIAAMRSEKMYEVADEVFCATLARELAKR